MSTETDVDIAGLVGPFEPTPCEHVEHGTGVFWHDNGPATHYRISTCPGCGYNTPVTAICQAFTDLLLANQVVRCHKNDCNYTGLASEFLTILSPVPTNA